MMFYVPCRGRQFLTPRQNVRYVPVLGYVVQTIYIDTYRFRYATVYARQGPIGFGGQNFRPPLPRRLKTARFPALLVFVGTKILLLQNCLAPEIGLFFGDFVRE